MQHQKQMPQSIRDFRPDVPVELVDICLKMIAKKPDQRYQTMYDVARMLNSWLATKGKGKPEGPSTQSSGHLLKGTRLGGGRKNVKPLQTKPKPLQTKPKPLATETLIPKPLPPAPDEDYSLADTSPGAAAQTVKGPGRSGKSDIFSESSSKSYKSGRTARTTSGNKPPPLPQPLDELPAVNDAFQALNQMPQTVLMQNQSYGSSRSHYRNSSEMPLWVYIAGAALAALVVIFILMVVSR
jgi:hypothetical protein